MMAEKVKPHHIRKYMDYWAEAGKEVTANRHLAFLQTFFGWLRQQNANIDSNPASKITKFKEEPRKVYISDEEYQRMFKAALSSPYPYVAAVMEIAYLCGLRKGEVLKLNMEDISSDGLIIKRSKGSRDEITEISPRLQEAINFCTSMHYGPEPLRNRPLIRSTKNSRLSPSALNKAWRIIREQAKLPHFRIHDLKKKAGTDGKDLGHRTQAMKDMYNLKTPIKKATK